jgi:transposase-like protein
MKGRKKMIASAVMDSADNIVSSVRPVFPEEVKQEIVLTVLRGENNLDLVCSTFGIDHQVFFLWSKEFLEKENRKLFENLLREKISDPGDELRKRIEAVRKKLAEL